MYKKVLEKSLKQVTWEKIGQVGRVRRGHKKFTAWKLIETKNSDMYHLLLVLTPSYIHTYTRVHIYIWIVRSHLQFVGTRKIINKYIIWKKSSNIYMWSGIKEFMVVELLPFQNIYRTISGREHEVFIFDKEKGYLHYVLWFIFFQICINIYVIYFSRLLIVF